MGDVNFPAAMVEAAARRLHEHDRLESLGEPPWEGLDDSDRASYLGTARAMLAAALLGCEATEQFAAADNGETFEWRDDRERAERDRELWFGGDPNVGMVRRLAITTEAEPVPTVESGGIDE